LLQQAAVVPALDNSTGVKTINLRGKLMLQIPSGNRFFGFKFVLPKEFPQKAPLCFLDEKEDPALLDLIDYLRPGNKIDIYFLSEWSNQYRPGMEQ
jgi:hypothetical protein